MNCEHQPVMEYTRGSTGAGKRPKSMAFRVRCKKCDKLYFPVVLVMISNNGGLYHRAFNSEEELKEFRI